MATKTPRRIRHVPARVAINPTDLTASFPHGGTEIGTVRDIVLRTDVRHAQVVAEEFGEVVEDVFVGSSVIAAMVIREFDSDAVSTLFPWAVTGSSSGEPVVRYPTTSQAGDLRSGDAVTLIITPVDEARHPATILYSAVPMVDDAAELTYSLEREFAVAAMFQGLRDGSGRIYEIGRLEDLTTP